MAPSATAERATTTTTERFERLPIARFFESPLNPRKTFDIDALRELAISIHEKDVIEPLVARPSGAQLEIICGARRFRAATAAGIPDLPVVVRAYTDAQAMEIMAIENGQRANVPPLEEAEGYQRLLLIEQTYTPLMIAKKIGHDERYVHNRLRLLQLVDEAKNLLAHGRIGVEHADVLSKLTPSDQKRALGRQTGGLWAPQDGLKFEEQPLPGSGAYDRLKPVTARELREWVAEHVRLDIHQAAKAAPLDFGETAARVAAAEAAGKGKTPVAITFSYMCPGGASDPNERTYGQNSWKKAENADGQPTCEHARLGTVVAGEQYAKAFLVCVNRDKCLVHWKDSVKAREKSAAARAKGNTKKAATIEKNSAQREQERWQQQNAKREAEQKAWAALEPHLYAEAAAQVSSVKALTPAHAKFLLAFDEFRFDEQEMKTHLGATWFKTPVAAILVTVVCTFYNTGFDEYVKQVAKPLGLDIKRLEAIRDKHAPKKDANPEKPQKAAKK